MAEEGFSMFEEEEPSKMFKIGARSESEVKEALEGATSRNNLLAPEGRFRAGVVCLVG